VGSRRRSSGSGGAAGRSTGQIRRLLFGADDADIGSVILVQNLPEETPCPVAMAFYATLLDGDEKAIARRAPPDAGHRRRRDARPADARGARPADRRGHRPERGTGRRPRRRAQRHLTRHEVVDEAFLALLDRVEESSRQAG
jgi:hypothetical protein